MSIESRSCGVTRSISGSKPVSLSTPSYWQWSDSRNFYVIGMSFSKDFWRSSTRNFLVGRIGRTFLDAGMIVVNGDGTLTVLPPSGES